MQQNNGEKCSKIIATDGGFPSVRKMFLGAHMVNNFYWAKPDKKETSAYNATIYPNLAMVAKRDISAGDEIFVDYNFDVKALC